MRSYVGITIGPIYDTISDATSPAALWFASSLFSDLTRRICEALKAEQSFGQMEIYSPFYSGDIKSDDGVGKFHDRIFFSTEYFSRETLDEILKKAKRETALCFPKDMQTAATEEFFEQYLQIHYVVRSEEQIGNQNCVLVLSPYLDSIELMKTFPTDDARNPIRALFLGENENGNKYIKDSELYHRIASEANQLRRNDGNIWQIEEVANCHGMFTADRKSKKYYAVVSADGDNMTTFLKQLSNDRLPLFSEACLKYAEAASALIGSFGGMTIYAGGDDLLFFAPVKTAEGTVFDLCRKLSDLFAEKMRQNESFKALDHLPTLSFGVAVQYVKYPLYEALENSRVQLALAKQDGDWEKQECKKNNMLVNLQKHSGQSIAVLASGDSIGTLEQFLLLGEQQEATVLHSIIYVMENYYSLIKVGDRGVKNNNNSFEQYWNVWENLFDNAGQKQYLGYIKQICKLYYEELLVKGQKGLSVPKAVLEQGELAETEDEIKTLTHILRLKKFLAEKEGAQE